MSDNLEIFDSFLKSLNQIEKNVDALKSDLNAISRDIRIFKDNLHRYAKNPLYLKKNALIVRVVNSFISSGLTLDASLYNTAEKLQEPLARVVTVYAVEKNRKKVVENQKVLFLIDRLNNAGFSKKEIAKISGFSENYVYDLIKKIDKSRQKF